jgi:hypothetical protein
MPVGGQIAFRRESPAIEPALSITRWERIEGGRGQKMNETFFLRTFRPVAQILLVCQNEMV